MKAQKTTFIATAISASLLTFATVRPAFSEPPSKHNAKALLDESKLIDYEQRITAKKTEMDRLNEDLKKGAEEIDALEKRIQKVGTAAEDATKQLDQFSSLKKRATAELELLNLRIDAEKLKGDGLRMLQAANRKLQDAAAKRNEETTARTALVAAETRQLATKAPAAAAAAESGPAKPHTPKNEPTLTEWRKNLEKAERATATSENQAREAMAAAGAKLQEAEAAAAKAEKKQEELALEKDPAFPGGNDPLSPAAKDPEKKTADQK